MPNYRDIFKTLENIIDEWGAHCLSRHDRAVLIAVKNIAEQAVELCTTIEAEEQDVYNRRDNDK